MDRKTYVIGVDIGTTSTKAIVFDSTGRIYGKAAREYPLYTDVVASAEQDPDEILGAVIQAVAEVMRTANISRHNIRCVGFSAAMHSVIPVDREGKPLMRCITWADGRASKEAQALLDLGAMDVYRRTGTPIHAMSPLAKIRWIRASFPNVFERAARFLSIKEYVFDKLFGMPVADYSMASATGLFNLTTLDWDEEALALAGIDRSRLAVLVPTTHQLVGLRDEYAQQLGIDAETPFVVGASDGVLANLGVYAMEPGVLAATIGTSGAVRAVVPKPLTDPDGRTFCYALTDQHWVIGGAINNGGLVLQWLRDQVFQGVDGIPQDQAYTWMNELAEAVPPGADGLLFLPFLMGERAPYWNADARGVYFGLARHHSRQHLIRAALEGVIYQMYNVTLTMEKLSGRFHEVRATGGFAQSPLWCQIMADVFQTHVTVPDNYESSCWGAAWLALWAIGEAQYLSDVSAHVPLVQSYIPDVSHGRSYQPLVAMFQRLYQRLEPEFRQVSQLQGQSSLS